MKREKHGYTKILCACTALVLMLTLFCCCMGITYGRYITTLANDVPFRVKPTQSFYLLTTSDSATGTVQEMSQGPALPWVTSGKVQTLSFMISNCDANEENIATEDMTVRIRVFVPDTESSGLGNLNMVLETQSDEKTYTAKGEYLSAQTPMYQDTRYGAGWVYYFYNETGEEFRTTLTGGNVHGLSVAIVLEGDTVDTSKFQLSIDKIHEM